MSNVLVMATRTTTGVLWTLTAPGIDESGETATLTAAVDAVRALLPSVPHPDERGAHWDLKNDVWCWKGTIAVE